MSDEQRQQIITELTEYINSLNDEDVEPAAHSLRELLNRRLRLISTHWQTIPAATELCTKLPDHNKRWNEQLYQDIINLITNGTDPFHALATLGFTNTTETKKLHDEIGLLKTEKQRQHDTITQLQTTIKQQRTDVQWDHLDHTAQRRMLSEAARRLADQAE